MNLEKSSTNIRKMDESMKASAIIDKNTAEYVESEVLLEGCSGAAIENIGTMDEDVAATAIPDQHH